MPYFDPHHSKGPDTQVELSTRRQTSLAGNNLYYWTRSPSLTNAYTVRTVYVDGSLSYGSANVDYLGVRPALNLSSEIRVSIIPNLERTYEISGANLLDLRFNDYEKDYLDQTVQAEIHESIYGNFINLQAPEGTDLSKLKASFITSPGATVKVDGDIQESGVTVNDFNDFLKAMVKPSPSPGS